MSMAIKAASYTGDPGFFDFIKKAAQIGTSFIPFVGTTISQAIGNVGGGAGPGSVPTRAQLAQQAGVARIPNLAWKRYQATGMLNLAQNGQVPAPGILPAIQRILPGGETGMMPAMNGKGMTAGGYHPNKSDYFLKSGEYVPAGTRWVKNRKRNPANARATSRAISRISGAKTYAKSLGRISIRKKC